VEINEKRNSDIVAEELTQSQKILGFETVIYETPLHDNGRPNLSVSNNLITKAESVAKGHDIIISHWREDHHQDHRVCYDVARSMARKNFEQFWCMDEPPYNLHYKNFQCNLYVDITEYIDSKQKALESYATYFDQHRIDTIINYNKYRGSFLGANKVAETFQIMYNKI
jgi:LmbE family N-acetylglucosaminyl deacetylase